MIQVQPRTKLITNVASKGFEEITILVHGAINVPQIDRRNAKVYLTGYVRNMSHICINLFKILFTFN
jgi:hypothetical protein